MNNVIKAVSAMVVAATVLVACNPAPQWYEVKGSNVYSCVGLEEDNNMGMCVNTNDKYMQSDVYETTYMPMYVGGEYVTVQYNNEECAVLRKGNVYDMETYCVGEGVVDTLELLQANVL